MVVTADEEGVGGDQTLADTDESQEERGRIGYGREERKSSWMLGAALIAIVLAIGAYQWWTGREDESLTDPAGVELATIGEPAPNFTLQTFQGDDFTLSDHVGKVVIVNFWGSWCEPCQREMPAFQNYWENAPDDVMFVGVGSKNDPEERSRAFAEEYGVTYPIGRDSAGSRVASGEIERMYKVSFFPMTYVIDPDGNISGLYVQELDEDQLDTIIQEARERVEMSVPVVWVRGA